jgi:hypothetical protein
MQPGGIAFLASMYSSPNTSIPTNTNNGNSTVNYSSIILPKNDFGSWDYWSKSSDGGLLSIYNGSLRQWYVNRATSLTPLYDLNSVAKLQEGYDTRMNIKIKARLFGIGGTGKIFDAVEGPVVHHNAEKLLSQLKEGKIDKLPRFFYTRVDMNTMAKGMKRCWIYWNCR